jgi:hypothetical protein
MNMRTNLEKIWNQLPAEIKESYGANYYKDFVVKLRQFSDRARPVEKICEVIDDLVDAVAGTCPQVRYILQLRERYGFAMLL